MDGWMREIRRDKQIQIKGRKVKSESKRDRQIINGIKMRKRMREKTIHYKLLQ